METNNIRYVALYRVSTQRQGISGLGLDSQVYAVKNYISHIGGEIIAEFTEVESGGNKDRISFNKKYSKELLLRKRPILKETIELAIKENATIVVKEPSRLTRYPLLMEYIISQHINFVSADSPGDDTTILRIKTALNAQELMKVSERTFLALQQKKIREGGKLKKKNNLTPEGRRKGTETVKARAREANYQAWDKVHDLFNRRKEDGTREYPTLAAIANRMNELGYTTSRGKSFGPMAVKRLLDCRFD